MARTLSVPSPTPYGIKFQITVSSVSSASSLSGCGVLLVVGGHEEAGSSNFGRHQEVDFIYTAEHHRCVMVLLAPLCRLPSFHGNLPFVNTFKDVDFRRVRGLKNGLHCRGILLGAFHLPSSPGTISWGTYRALGC